MQIKEIPFVGRRAPQSAVEVSQRIGLNWSPPFKLPVPVRVNGKLIQYINISEYGAIRFSEAKTGRYHYMPGDGKLPSGLTDFTDGFCVVPWGEPQRMSGCGLSTKIWNEGPVVIVEFVTKSTFYKLTYKYRVELHTDSTIKIFYYQCMSAYDTYVGMVMEPGNMVGWPIKVSQQYPKKALQIDTITKEPDPGESPDVPGSFPPSFPEPGRPVVDPDPKPPVVEVESYWVDRYIDDKVRLSVKRSQ